MPSYDYKCDICGHLYNEVRSAEDPQWFIKCPVKNCAGLLLEVNPEPTEEIN